MCKASKYVSELESLVRNIKNDFEVLSQKQSYYDSMVAEHYHKIENMNFNACEGYYLTKQLQETLRKRRIVKDELARLDVLRQTLDFKHMSNSINKSRQCINRSNKKASDWQQDWKYTYLLEEILS